MSDLSLILANILCTIEEIIISQVHITFCNVIGCQNDEKQKQNDQKTARQGKTRKPRKHLDHLIKQMLQELIHFQA